MGTVNYNQRSFAGGMNLLLDDSDLQTNQYKVGFNLRNRYSKLDPIQRSIEDVNAPIGLKQEIVTFGTFIILFVAGKAYYRNYTATGWSPIPGFLMSTTAPRFWTKAIPVATTNYSRFTIPDATINDIERFNTASSAFGQAPGLVVQDNINQPFFIFINGDGNPIARKTQTYEQWEIQYNDNGTIIGEDKREYVPIGNCMEFVDGVLYIVSPDKALVLRSVSGRPLDFVINVDANGQSGGDAYTTSYSVGVNEITCIRALADASLFVSAGGSNFSVSKDKSNVAVKEWGEFTFIRNPLFNATCLSDRAIFDSLGDTRFIDLTGVRSFNAIQQEQNEGRNSVFSSTISPALSSLVQSDALAAGILYNNFELYALNTIFGYAIAVYDTLLNCWVAFDLNQTALKGIKQFAKIDLTVQRLYAITEDNRLFSLYIDARQDMPILRTGGIASDMIPSEQNINTNICGNELKPTEFRAVFNNVSADCVVTLDPYVNNYKIADNALEFPIKYFPPTYTDDLVMFPDTNTQLSNIIFSMPNCKQGWRCFFVVTWTNGSLLKYSVAFATQTPMNPLASQRK